MSGSCIHSLLKTQSSSVLPSSTTSILSVLSDPMIGMILSCLDRSSRHEMIKTCQRICKINKLMNMIIIPYVDNIRRIDGDYRLRIKEIIIEHANGDDLFTL